MREARDAAARRAQQLMDEAKLLRIRADAKEAEAKMIVGEINEGVPVPVDN